MSEEQSIVTSIWFDNNAEEAVDFYCSVFPDSRIVEIIRYTQAMPEKDGMVAGITYELAGQRFIAINGGPEFIPSPAISLFVPCDTQAEIDRLWDALLADGGKELHCGWLTDRYGVTWQIAPKSLLPMMQDSDRARAARGAPAMYGMVRLDIAGLQQAYDSQ